MDYAIDLILLFFAYSLLGWCIEVTLKYIQFHRFINRGFLTGPICPIYGSGAALITLIVGGLSRLESGYGTTFALSFLICGAVEYLTSYCMEKRFHARWWDYSQKPMNLNGRVWIGNLVLFGLGGIAIIHIINPLVYRVLDDCFRPSTVVQPLNFEKRFTVLSREVRIFLVRRMPGSNQMFFTRRVLPL